MASSTKNYISLRILSIIRPGIVYELLRLTNLCQFYIMHVECHWSRYELYKAIPTNSSPSRIFTHVGVEWVYGLCFSTFSFYLKRAADCVFRRWNCSFCCATTTARTTYSFWCAWLCVYVQVRYNANNGLKRRNERE